MTTKGVLTVCALVLIGSCDFMRPLCGCTPIPTTLAFKVQPSNSVSGSIITPAIQVVVTGEPGDLSSSDPITLTIQPNTGTSGAILGGTRTASAISGIATFSNLTIDKPGIGYVLVASWSRAPQPVTSLTFNVTAPP